MLLELVRLIRNPDLQRRTLLAVMLLSGAAPFMACVPIMPTISCSGSDCDPPVQGLHDPNFHAGATVSLRTPAAGDNGVTLFARTGVLAPIDGNSSGATPPLPGGVAPSGTASQRENIAVPLYGGVTIPAKNVGVPIPNLSFEAFGGANIKNEKFGFSLNEFDRRRRFCLADLLDRQSRSGRRYSVLSRHVLRFPHQSRRRLYCGFTAGQS